MIESEAAQIKASDHKNPELRKRPRMAGAGMKPETRHQRHNTNKKKNKKWITENWTH